MFKLTYNDDSLEKILSHQKSYFDTDSVITVHELQGN